ncbi:hypothetical protein JTB14_018350 [Gonioctena quinquepunctata]|nr:hypothetical protein JTB14_018350 [Gonioctena quinquepunctata]
MDRNHFNNSIEVINIIMFKLVFIGMLVSAASAGVIGGLGYGGNLGHGLGGLGHGLVAVATPAVAVAHGASSYQNNNLLALHPTPVVTKVAAPIAVASPILAAPVHYGVASDGLGLGIGRGLSLGYH